jgi:hypothetical protein
VNDWLTAIYENEALRYTLLLAPALYVFVALFFWIASRSPMPTRLRRKSMITAMTSLIVDRCAKAGRNLGTY